MSAVIISGGKIDKAQLKEHLKVGAPFIIAADKGIEICEEISIRPDCVIGDMDSSGEQKQSLLSLWEKEGVKIIRLNPIKDDTDTEAAIRYALDVSKGEVTVFGATGSRMDHFLGNLSCIGIGLSTGRLITLLDANNRIRMYDKSFEIVKNDCFGSFISFFPFGEKVSNLTLEGFKYPLYAHELKGYNSLGVSNEIIDETASVSFDSGVIVVVESRD